VPDLRSGGNPPPNLTTGRAPVQPNGMVRYGMVNVDLYGAIITKVSDALNTLVSGEKPGFQAPSKGLIVLLCAEVTLTVDAFPHRLYLSGAQKATHALERYCRISVKV